MQHFRYIIANFDEQIQFFSETKKKCRKFNIYNVVCSNIFAIQSIFYCNYLNWLYEISVQALVFFPVVISFDFIWNNIRFIIGHTS